jgi:cellulose synthase/poly-beta-1,6-N-acetylglucosamine synthase-like glycosyltransferase
MVEVIFWVPVFLLFHSYVLFPSMLYWLARNKHNNNDIYDRTSQLPFVSVIISVYNEEAVIRQRVRNILGENYLAIELLIGSDGSTDHTNAILQSLTLEFPSLRIFLFDQRKGKGEVLNSLIPEAKGEILLLTDAKVEFSSSVVFQLVKHFRNPNIGMVGGNIVNQYSHKDGISIQEMRFMSREMLIKYNEGKLWGTVMGVYGACFAVRRELVEKIPQDFAVEDFFITLKVLEKKYKGIIELEAVCYEEVPNCIDEEFRRKVRISSGNFQNMKSFLPMLLKPGALSFCFFSHKIIRWIGPFLLLTPFLCNFFLLSHSPIYVFTFIVQLILFALPIIDYFLQKIHIHIITLRFVTHFYSMNLALLLGFIKYLKGVKTNVWEPTRRAFRKT